MSRALSQKRSETPNTLEVMPRRARRTSSTPSLASAARCGIDNPQYEQEIPKVSFDLVRADSQGLASNGLEGEVGNDGEVRKEASVERHGQSDIAESESNGNLHVTTHL